MATDKLKQIGDAISNDYLGFIPTSNSTKPPHIANGLFRHCIGETCDTRDVHEWMFEDNAKNSTPSEEILNKYEELFQNGFQEKITNIKEFRFMLEEIFDQDNGAYAGPANYGFSVMTISSHWMVRGAVNSEGHIGEFLFKILAKQINGKRSPVISLIQKALENDNDDVTNLVKPIIAFPSEKEKRNKSSVDYLDDSNTTWDSCKQIIREGYDRLSANLEITGESKNSLLVLRRIVNYSIFATFLYLTHCNHAIYSGDKPPIVIDAGGDLESVKNASEQAYTSAKKAVEDYYANAIKQWLSDEIATDSIDACKRWIEGMTFSTQDRADTIRPALSSYFESFSGEEASAIMALSRALQIVLYTCEYKNSSPSDFCRVLGVRSGLIGPKGNRAKVKRYLINSFTLETITLSTLSTEELTEGIELKELSGRLIDKYNIVIGADSEHEYGLLEKYNIAQATPGDLRGDLSINAQKLADTYISLGLGKKYADGVTLIGWRL
jgi:hypothetical protein